jgi:hypothetical protein
MIAKFDGGKKSNFALTVMRRGQGRVTAQLDIRHASDVRSGLVLTVLASEAPMDGFPKGRNWKRVIRYDDQAHKPCVLGVRARQAT